MGKTTVNKVLGDRERTQVREVPSEPVFPESARVYDMICLIS